MTEGREDDVMARDPQSRGSASGNPLVDATLRLERAEALDAVVGVTAPISRWLVADPTRERILHGRFLGHALHPVLTDVPTGAWMSATVLDLLGGEQSRPAARTLVGVGVLAALPTALTGLAELAVAGEKEKRVGVVHAGANILALTLSTTSWLARRSGAHRLGAILSLAAGGAVGIGGYLGGHLVVARHVGSRDGAFES